MLGRLIDNFLDRPWLVVAGLPALIAVGLQALWTIPIDAFPDLTNNQVTVVTEAPGLAPVEVEQLVSFPLESAMMGIPDTQEVRSISKLGLSMITVVFEDGVPSLTARQLVNERLLDARSSLPAGINPQMGLLATPFGEVFQYTLHSPHLSAMDLKALHEWEIKFMLRAIPGVADVVTWGGSSKRYEIEVDPERLRSYGLTLRDVFERIAANNRNLSGGFVAHGSEQYSVRGTGWARGPDELLGIVLKAEAGTPVRVGDVAEVRVGVVPRQGAVTRNASGETLSGMVVMLKGQNSKTIIERVKAALEDFKPSLPESVEILPFYDQSEVIDGTIRTVRNNLVEGGALVVLVLLLGLGNLRAAVIVALVIPLAMLGAFVGMKLFGVSANLMSLGAVDFGVVIEGAVVVAENAVRRLQGQARTLSPRARLETLRASTKEVAGPVMAGAAILILVYMPILGLQDLEGRMFRPMAITVCSAVLTSLLLAFFAVPTACRYLLPPGVEEGRRHRALERVESIYRRVLSRVVDRPRIAAAGAVIVVGTALGSLAWIGVEFMPRLDEGSILVQAMKIPSISLDESVHMQQQVEQALVDMPEVTHVVSKIGRPDFATEAMGIYESDVYIGLQPRDQWSVGSKQELIAKMAARLEKTPGVVYNFTQPMAMRLDETVSGVRADVAVKIFGPDEAELERLAELIVGELAAIPGAADVQREVFSGAAEWRVDVRRDQLARYGLNVSDVQELLAVAVGGRSVTTILDGRRRFDVAVRLTAEHRSHIDRLRALQLQTPDGAWVRLDEVADVGESIGPEVVRRQDGQRRLVAQCNVRGRDIGSFVNEAQQRLAARFELPTGYYLGWGGQFENQQRAMRRLSIVTPAALVLIFLICYATFGSTRESALIMLLAPFAAVGGIGALWLRGMNLNVSAAIGFIAVFGIATIDGLVLVSTIKRRLAEGLESRRARLDAAATRLRPVMMISIVAALGLLPMATATSIGAEVQRPLATVVIGGVISSALLTLLLVPTFYPWFAARRKDSPTS